MIYIYNFSIIIMVIFLYTIGNDVENNLKIKNSNFITYLFYINSINDILLNIKRIKELHPKATHHCYAYVLGNICKYSDDGEPSSTAGAPIMNVLKKNNLDNVLAIVVRYFGGIKLGASGLVRAYTLSITEALLKTDLVLVVSGVKIKVKLDYKNISNFEYLIRDYNIISKVFDDEIYYIVVIEKDNLEILSNYKYEILEYVNIKKKV